MKKLTEKEIQNYICELLKRYIRFCNDNHLTYYIAYGSLLGTVRHKGFIPWDNDLDVMMPREDYTKFITLAKDALGFQIKERSLVSGYMYDYAKITDGITRIETFYMKDIKDMGVFIDIFPMDPVYIPDEEYENVKKKIDFNHSMMIMSGSKRIRPSKNGFRLFLKRFAYIYSKIRGTKYWLNEKDKIIADAQKETGCANRYIVGEDIISSKYFHGKAVEKEFENIPVACPSDFTGLLTELYGDFMQLPPMENRISTHDFVAYIMD